MSRIVTMSEALNEALREEMALGNLQLLLGEDVCFNGGLFGVTKGLVDEFGEERVLNMPISEASFTGFGLGSALVGCPAVVEIQILPFITLAMDQICNRAAKLRYMSGGQLSVPLVVRSPGAGRIGLAAQHSESLEGWFIQVAGLKVVNPATPADAKGLLKSAIRDGNPVLFLEHRLLYATRGPVPADEELVPLGKARIARPGDDITLIAHGVGVKLAESAARELEARGVAAEVIDLRTLKPLDVDTIVESVIKTKRAVVISDGPPVGGLASEVVSAIVESEAFFHLEAQLRRVTAADVPIPYAQNLEEAVLPQPAKVVAAVESALELA
jgi:pyruvate/2-oxoglutarate/acetoin dehydrogenase E1 component